MKATYIRVSTTEQNTDRQQTEAIGKVYIDKISGSIAFKERPAAKKLLKQLNSLETLYVHSIDRLGRNTLDIMTTIQLFTDNGVNVISEKEGLRTLDPDGKPNPVAKMLVGILGTLAEFELARLKERQAEGIERAKQRGAYIEHGGSKKLKDEEFLNKAANAKALKELNRGESIRRTANLAGVSTPTVQKVKRIAERLGMYNPPPIGRIAQQGGRIAQPKGRIK